MTASHPLSSELILEAVSGEKTNIKNLPAPIMQALYYQITGKREKILKQYNADYIVNKDVIRELVVKLGQTLDQYVVQGSNISATIIHFKKDKQNCSSIEKFSQYDSSRTDPVSSIALKFDFLITPPGVSEAQSYTISININSFVLLKADKFASSGLGFYRDSRNFLDVELDYVDYVVARSFLSTLDEWVDSLSKVGVFRLPALFADFRFPFIESLKGILSLSLSYIFYVYLFGEHISTYSLFVAISLFFVFKIFAEYLIDYAHDMMVPHAYFPFIVMNRGDERNLQKFRLKRRRYVAIGAAILSGVTIGVSVNLLSIPMARLFFGS